MKEFNNLRDAKIFETASKTKENGGKTRDAMDRIQMHIDEVIKIPTQIKTLRNLYEKLFSSYPKESGFVKEFFDLAEKIDKNPALILDPQISEKFVNLYIVIAFSPIVRSRGFLKTHFKNIYDEIRNNSFKTFLEISSNKNKLKFEISGIKMLLNNYEQSIYYLKKEKLVISSYLDSYKKRLDKYEEILKQNPKEAKDDYENRLKFFENNKAL